MCCEKKLVGKPVFDGNLDGPDAPSSLMPWFISRAAKIVGSAKLPSSRWRAHLEFGECLLCRRKDLACAIDDPRTSIGPRRNRDCVAARSQRRGNGNPLGDGRSV